MLRILCSTLLVALPHFVRSSFSAGASAGARSTFGIVVRFAAVMAVLGVSPVNRPVWGAEQEESIVDQSEVDSAGEAAAGQVLEITSGESNEMPPTTQAIEKSDSQQARRAACLRALARLLQAVGDAGFRLEEWAQPGATKGGKNEVEVSDNVVESVSGDDAQLYKGNSAEATINVLSGINVRINVFVGDPRMVPEFQREMGSDPAESGRPQVQPRESTTTLGPTRVER